MIYVNDFIQEDYVWFLNENDKANVLNTMIEGLSASPNVLNPQQFKKAVLEREKVMSTGLGLGIAIPHVKSKSVKEITLGIGVLHKGMDWDALDGVPVQLVFLFAAGEDQHQMYLRLLSKIILILKNKNRREKLIHTTTPQQVIELFQGV